MFKVGTSESGNRTWRDKKIHDFHNFSNSGLKFYMRISECICNRIMMTKNIDFLTHLQEKLRLNYLALPSLAKEFHGDCFFLFKELVARLVSFTTQTIRHWSYLGNRSRSQNRTLRMELIHRIISSLDIFLVNDYIYHYRISNATCSNLRLGSFILLYTNFISTRVINYLSIFNCKGSQIAFFVANFNHRIIGKNCKNIVTIVIRTRGKRN